MKRITLYTFIIISSINMLFGQSITLKQVVLPTQGAHYRVGNTALSWTLGEPAHTTITNSDKVLTQGLQQIERPMTMDSIPSKRVCSDTTEQIVFRNVQAGKWAGHVEWATNSSFAGSQIIRSKDSIVLTIDSSEIDTIWLRSVVGYRGLKGPVTKTQASVLPNISVANKITVANDLCGVIDTIRLDGVNVEGNYFYQWEKSVEGIHFVEVTEEIGSILYIGGSSSTGWYRRIMYESGHCEKISNTLKIQ